MAKKTTRITEKMADALGCTIKMQGRYTERQAMIMSHPKTQAALTARGLADEYGYLTDAGRFVAWMISVGSEYRAWSREELEAGTRTWLRDQERHQWPNRLTLEEALSEAYPETEDKPAVRVTIEYSDGTEEIVNNIPTNEIAVGIYAEATYNDRVRKAVLYRADGTETAVFTNTCACQGSWSFDRNGVRWNSPIDPER